MSTSKKITLPLILMMVALLSFGSLSAHGRYATAETATPVDQTQLLGIDKIKIKIIIIIVIVIKKKGVVEAQSIRLAEEGATLKANEILAEASVEGKQLQVSTLKGEQASSELIIPANLKLAPQVSQKLGLKASASLKAGKFQPGPNKLGNFEIQD